MPRRAWSRAGPARSSRGAAGSTVWCSRTWAIRRSPFARRLDEAPVFAAGPALRRGQHARRAALREERVLRARGIDAPERRAPDANQRHAPGVVLARGGNLRFGDPARALVEPRARREDDARQE